MVSERPSISVLIRTYNAASSLPAALASVLHQTMDPGTYEVVAIDGGSSDGTTSILEKHHARVRWFQQSRPGNIVAINEGITRAQGSSIVLLDADDEFVPEALATLHAALRSHPDAGFAYSDYYEVSVGGARTRVIVGEDIFQTVAAGILWRRSMIDQVGGYDEGMRWAEYDLLLKASQRFIGTYVPRPLYVYRRHAGSLTMDRLWVAAANDQLVQRYGAVARRIRSY